MLQIIKSSYEKERRKGLCPELGAAQNLDVEFRSENCNLNVVRKLAFRDLKNKGEDVNADYIFVNQASYVPLWLPESGILYFIDGEARQKLKKAND